MASQQISVTLCRIKKLNFYIFYLDTYVNTKYGTPNGTVAISPTNPGASGRSTSNTTVTAGIPCHSFGEKLIPVLVDLFCQAPAVEKCIMFPEIIQNLGRYSNISLLRQTLVATCFLNLKKVLISYRLV